MSEQEKYQILENDTLHNMTNEINEATTQGYKLHTFIGNQLQGEYGPYTQYVAVMSLSSSTKYDDIERLVDVAPHEVNGWLDKGYIVADSWAKNIRMVKKK